jgi:hypothetical protein
MRTLATIIIIGLFVTWAVAGYIHTINDTNPDHFYE